jgi:hypothetical protein
MHDVFISHRNENRAWAAALADNLERCGLKAWVHLAEPTPGKPMAGPAQEALRDSRHGIVLATPEALESGGAGDDCEAMLARRKAAPDFNIVPLFFGTAPKFPFLDRRFCVDFADPAPEAYRAAFRALLRRLRSQPADAAVDLPASLEIPQPPLPRLEDMPARPLAPGEAAFLGPLFEALNANRPIMLLAQADHDKTAMHRAILAEARRRFGVDNTFHLAPLGQPDADKAEYFSYLGNQIDSGKNSQKPGDFEFLVADRLARGKSVFLLMTRIEEGSAEGRRALSHALRNLSERYYDWLRVVLCGGEHLLELRFKEGKLSPLRNAQALLWPEPSAADILHWQAPDAHPLTEEAAATLLRLTGGNARLIRQALKMQQISAPLDLAAVAQKLRQDPVLRARFSAYRHNGDAERLASLLKRDDLGHYEPWPIQALLRRLYWDGLLVESGGRFRWRCDLIRLIGRETLGA